MNICLSRSPQYNNRLIHLVIMLYISNLSYLLLLLYLGSSSRETQFRCEKVGQYIDNIGESGNQIDILSGINIFIGFQEALVRSGHIHAPALNFRLNGSCYIRSNTREIS